jgi:peptide/nickel transport system permease protein
MVTILPDDVAYTIAGEDASPEDIQAIREELGLNRNLVVRYVDWLGQLAQGNFGESHLTSEPVLDAIVSVCRLPLN